MCQVELNASTRVSATRTESPIVTSSICRLLLRRFARVSDNSSVRGDFSRVFRQTRGQRAILSARIMMLNPDAAYTAAPLWKWLFDPALRIQLHRHAAAAARPQSDLSAPAPAPATVMVSSPGTHEADASHWRRRLATKSLPTTLDGRGSSGDVPRSSAPAGRASAFLLEGKDSYLFGRLPHPADVASVAGVRKIDSRFAAKTDAPNLIGLVQRRTMHVMSSNLVPLRRDAVDGNRFETVSAALSMLHRIVLRAAGGGGGAAQCEAGESATTRAAAAAAGALCDEMLAWRQCVRSLTPSAANAVALTRPAFVEVASRICQLCCLEESPDDAGLAASLRECVRLAERDWVNLEACGRCTVGGAATAALAFQVLFDGVLLPAAVVMAPPAASTTEQSMAEHTTDFLSSLRRILFAIVSPKSGGHPAAIVEQRAQPSAADGNIRGRRSRAFELRTNMPHAMHVGVTYAQRIVPPGFYEPPPPSMVSPRRRMVATRTVSPSAARGASASASAPIGVGGGGGGVGRPTVTPPGACPAHVPMFVIKQHHTDRRKPRVLEALLARAGDGGGGGVAAGSSSSSSPVVARVASAGSFARADGTSAGAVPLLPRSDELSAGERFRTLGQARVAAEAATAAPRPAPVVHNVSIDFSSEQRLGTATDMSSSSPACGARPPVQQGLAVRPASNRYRRTMVSATPHELVARRLVASPSKSP